MKNLNKRRVTFLVILIFMVIIEILALGLSKAKNIKEINITLSDLEGILEDEKILLNATDDGESGYYIVLPEVVNEKFINKYLVQEKQIQKEVSDNENANNEIINNEIDSNSIDNNEISNNEVVNNEIYENNIDITTEELIEVEKFSGDKIYLTKEEIENKQMNLKVKYDKEVVKEVTLYKKQIEKEKDQFAVCIEGYMPIDSKIVIEDVNTEEVKNISKEYVNENSVLNVAYDIKILYQEKEYNPSDFDKDIKVTFAGINTSENKEQKYKILHITDEKEVKEINGIETQERDISFMTNSFSTYAVFSDAIEGEEISSQVLSIPYMLSNAILSENNDTWDGTSANSFKYGQGTRYKSIPYIYC